MFFRANYCYPKGKFKLIVSGISVCALWLFIDLENECVIVLLIVRTDCNLITLLAIRIIRDKQIFNCAGI